MPSLAFLPLFLALQSPAPAPDRGFAATHRLALGPATAPDAPFLAALATELGRSAPGVGVQWLPAATRLATAGQPTRAAFVQLGAGRVRLAGTAESDFAVGDLLLLRAGQELRLEPAAGLLVFDLPQALDEGLPWIVRPDWDPRITDTPGGCATDEDAYRRILLTWESAKGPYVHHGLNAHRVRVRDSFTHYHPREGGFDELYLVQDAAPGAGLWIGERLEPFLDPEHAPLDPAAPPLVFLPVAAGDLVWLPRGVVHRGVGGILAQVIALPGFVSGMELGVDDAIRRLNRRLEPGRALAAHGDPPWVEVLPGPEGVAITIGGRPFTLYRAGDEPCFYPVRNPEGRALTRAFPLETRADQERAGESRDHPHHRSLWFAHGAVNGLDFWTTGAPTVRPTGIGAHGSGAGRGFFESRDDWLAPDGSLVCRDRRRFEAFALEGAFGLDVDVTLVAPEHEVRLGDTKEGTLAVRVAPGLKVDNAERPGRLLNSSGQEGAAAWGQRARWVLAAGQVDGAPAAIALLDHPDNLRHPTTWHARTYGLVAANPFGLHDFEGADEGAGDVVLPPGGELRLRYRLLFWSGVPSSERLDALWSEYAGR